MRRCDEDFDEYFDEFSESELDELSDDECYVCSDAFQDEFDDADDIDQEEEEEKQIDKIMRFGGHAPLLCDAAKHLEKGEGGDVNLARSAELCVMALSLEHGKPAVECDPRHYNNTFTGVYDAL